MIGCMLRKGANMSLVLALALQTRLHAAAAAATAAAACGRRCASGGAGAPQPPPSPSPQQQQQKQQQQQQQQQQPSQSLPQQPQRATRAQLQQLQEAKKQLQATTAEKRIAKLPERQLLLSKRLGWLLSGTAIGLLSAFFGKLYMLFGAIPLFVYHSRDIDVISRTFNRDATFLWRHSKAWMLSKRIRNENLTLTKVFQLTERRHPDKIMLQMHDQNWKYKDVASYANRTSRLMQKYGFRKGDVIAMMALNSPEMVAIVLGMANLGIITAVINVELRGASLAHAIRNSGCKGIIFDDELMHAFGDVYRAFPAAKIFQMRHKAKQPDFHVLEEELLKEYNDVPEVFISVQHDDPLLYIYASEDGASREPTTITHSKFLFDAMVTAMTLDLKPWEQIYNPSPLYECTGMVLGVGPAITHGVTTVLRPRFSAVDYFRECYVHHCTVGQYSGTMCKQLLLAPVSPIETFHPVRAMYGTGLDCDYWQEFVDRYGTKMFEVRDASPDNINLINMEGKVGVIGFRPKLAPSFLFPHYVIKVFGKDNIPVRGADGLCQLCDCNEPGLLVKMWKGSSSLPAKVKTIQNVFKNGDMAITTGEILTLDEQQYLRPPRRYADKTWMRKLVTSEEVEYIAAKLSKKRCATYTITVDDKKQNVDVLAVEDVDKSLDMKQFTEALVEQLPRNWLPQYIRIVASFQLDVAKKIDKSRLVAQGLNIQHDQVYVLDAATLSFQPLIWEKGGQMSIFATTAAPTAAPTAATTATATAMAAPKSAKASSTDKPKMNVEVVRDHRPQKKLEPIQVDVLTKLANIDPAKFSPSCQSTSASSPKTGLGEKQPPGGAERTVGPDTSAGRGAAASTPTPADTTIPTHKMAPRVQERQINKHKTVVTPTKSTSSSTQPSPPPPPPPTKSQATGIGETANELADLISRKFRTFAEPVMNKLMKDRLRESSDEKSKSKRAATNASRTPPLSASETLHKLDLNAVEQKTRSLIDSVLQTKAGGNTTASDASNATNAVKCNPVDDGVKKEEQLQQTKPPNTTLTSDNSTTLGFDATKPSKKP